MQQTCIRLWKEPLWHVVQDGRFFLQSLLICFFRSEQQHFLTNKLSLNLLQDRLACESHPSLEGVIVMNLVVNTRAKSGQIALAQAQHRCAHRCPPQTLARPCAVTISAFFTFVRGNEEGE
jgi:hypothetical protein